MNIQPYDKSYSAIDTRIIQYINTVCVENVIADTFLNWHILFSDDNDNIRHSHKFFLPNFAFNWDNQNKTILTFDLVSYV